MGYADVEEWSRLQVELLSYLQNWRCAFFFIINKALLFESKWVRMIHFTLQSKSVTVEPRGQSLKDI